MPALSQSVRKTKRKLFRPLCLEDFGFSEEKMGNIHRYVWEQFPPMYKTATGKDYLISLIRHLRKTWQGLQKSSAGPPMMGAPS